ncbi:hypothetical protein RvY_09467 [Ramazzottius varieornatus]|uniref:Uncharacterized protein n=1 Tax=Ramazzottius varieornatus TaxID=947166 RepID=A0A1D1VHC7_RAMVA|nr:hypothetical protein RvY_09467 [Ramazzottius varieornatus]
MELKETSRLAAKTLDTPAPVSTPSVPVTTNQEVPWKVGQKVSAFSGGFYFRPAVITRLPSADQGEYQVRTLHDSKVATVEPQNILSPQEYLRRGRNVHVFRGRRNGTTYSEEVVLEDVTEEDPTMYRCRQEDRCQAEVSEAEIGISKVEVRLIKQKQQLLRVLWAIFIVLVTCFCLLPITFALGRQLLSIRNTVATMIVIACLTFVVFSFLFATKP